MSDATLVCPQCGYTNPGGTKLCVRCQHAFKVETSHIEPESEIESVLNWGTKTLDQKLFLHVRGSSQSIEVILEEGIEIVIGRYDPTNDVYPEIDLTEYNAADKGVSRNHATLFFDNGSIKIADLDSANATYLNGQKLVPRQSRLLRDGDEVRLGNLQLTVQFG